LVVIQDDELLGATALGPFLPLLIAVVHARLVGVAPGTATGAHVSDPLLSSALLALVKCMAVSADVCEAHLPLVFTAYAGARDPALRSSLGTALGDLVYRFPNSVEPFTAHLYARLRDGDTGVRRNALLVVSHLLLSGMVKVKGNVGEIAVCMHDPDPAIAAHATVVSARPPARGCMMWCAPLHPPPRLPVRNHNAQFFHELSKRSNNPIYNLLPDTLATLSRLVAASEEAAAGGAAAGEWVRPFTRDAFRDVVKFLLGFIGKDKHSEGLADKLLHRFEASDDPTVWRDVAFCLTQLPLNDKMVRKLAEGVRVYKRALADDDVWASVGALVAKSKRVIATKPEVKDVVAEWEVALGELRSAAVEDAATNNAARAASRKAAVIAAHEGLADKLTAEAAERAAAVAAAVAAASAAEAKGKGKGGKAGTKPAARKPAAGAAAGAAKGKGKGKARKAAAVSDGETDSDGGEAQVGDSDEENAAGRGKAAKGKGKGAGGGRRGGRAAAAVVADSDEEL